MTRINPFKPYSPVQPGMFVGRVREILRLEKCLIQTRAGYPASFLITGERGIGKSSLMNYLRFVASGIIPIDSEKARFLVIHTDIEQTTTQLGLVKKIELGLRKELGKYERTRTFLNGAWQFLKKIESVGVVTFRSDAGNEQSETMIEEFSYALAETAKRICSDSEQSPILDAQFDGIILLIDEADSGSKELNLGTFLKLLMERLDRHGCDKMMVGLAGLTELRDVLSASHQSSLRLFEEVELARLSNEEVDCVISICLKKANEINEDQTSIENEARQSLITYSEGYPHFIQQFGYSAFSTDQDGIISNKDVNQGSFGAGGALEAIGNRYYRDDFYRKIKKDSYRQVLRIMAKNLDNWVSKSEIRREFKGKESTLDNALKALRDRHIIMSKEGERGTYRLQHKGFALWITYYSSQSFEKSLFQNREPKTPDTSQ